jgi:oxygen-independent coproporphyrinogen-3 oxidase
MGNSIGIYIHIPFCKSKCNYCDFNSYSGREYLAGPYFDALFSEMKLRSDEIGERLIKTVFIGGGTPSLVAPKHISAVLELCSKLFKLDSEAEISMESNPGTLTYDSLKDYRAAGVNRLSIGLQAWQDRMLKELGRIHDRRQFVDNFEAAVKAGFRNINVDLIFGLPGHTMEEWVETLEEVTALRVFADCGLDTGVDSGLDVNSGAGLTHLSCYSLKIEEGTNFGDRYEKGTLKPADDELDRKMYRYAIEYLARMGFRQYEISNFALPGFECRHNLVYWKALEYAGFGAGAHSYLHNNRFGNVSDIEQYINAVNQRAAGLHTDLSRISEQNLQNKEFFDFSPVYSLHEDIQHISTYESMSEFMILGLRLTDGVSAAEFNGRYGENLQAVYGDKLEKLVKEGLLVREWNGNREVCSESGNMIDSSCYKLTSLGLDLANQVFIEFI